MECETHVMVDLETLGTEPGSVILSIGAVHFGGGQILDTFQASILPKSCMKLGMKADPSTMLWWMEQSTEARKALMKGQHRAESIMHVLDYFTRWVSQRCGGCLDLKSVRIWGNGASFDCAMLMAAYRMADIPAPWKYSGERCYRTVKALNPDVVEDARDGTHHDALADAEHQAKHLMRILTDI